MSLLEWVRVAEDAREQQDDERVATGLESLPGWPWASWFPWIGSRSSPVDSPERALQRDPGRLPEALDARSVEGACARGVPRLGGGPDQHGVRARAAGGSDCRRDGDRDHGQRNGQRVHRTRRPPVPSERELRERRAGAGAHRSHFRPFGPAGRRIVAHGQRRCPRAIASTWCCRRSPSMGRCSPFAPSRGAS